MVAAPRLSGLASSRQVPRNGWSMGPRSSCMAKSRGTGSLWNRQNPSTHFPVRISDSGNAENGPTQHLKSYSRILLSISLSSRKDSRDPRRVPSTRSAFAQTPIIIAEFCWSHSLLGLVLDSALRWPQRLRRPCSAPYDVSFCTIAPEDALFCRRLR